MFSNYYFSQYNYDSKGLQLFATDYLDVVKYCKHLRHKEIQILDTISAQPYIYVLLENKISPYYFKKNNIKVVDNNFEKTYIFKNSMQLASQIGKSGNREEKAYIVFNNTHWNNKFKVYKLQKKEFGKICLFYE